MHRLAVLFAFASLAAPAAMAQAGPDPMKTPQCLQARQQLDAALAAGGPAGRLAAAREQAALSCLGSRPPPAPEGRFVPPPEPVAPIRLPAAPAAASATIGPTAAPPPPVAIPRPPVLTGCDPSGCWDSNGTRYNQQGPMLIGPRGVCTLQAGTLNCP